MSKQRVIYESEGEEYWHKEVWRVVLRRFERPADPKTGEMYDDLVAMVFALHAFEGYLNYIGDKLLPEIWEEERSIEGGLEGKLKLILEACGLPGFDKGRRPFATVIALKELRDGIAHPKIYKPKTCKTYSHGKEPSPVPSIHLHTLVCRDKATRARDDVRSIVDRVHAAAVAKYPALHLGDDGLGGILHQHTHKVRLDE